MAKSASTNPNKGQRVFVLIHQKTGLVNVTLDPLWHIKFLIIQKRYWKLWDPLESKCWIWFKEMRCKTWKLFKGYWKQMHQMKEKNTWENPIVRWCFKIRYPNEQNLDTSHDLLPTCQNMCIKWCLAIDDETMALVAWFRKTLDLIQSLTHKINTSFQHQVMETEPLLIIILWKVYVSLKLISFCI